MKRTFRLLGALALSAVIPVGILADTAATASTTTCSTSKVAVTHLVKVTEKVHGRTEVVKKKEDVHRKERVRVHVRVTVDGKSKLVWRTEVREVVDYRSVTTCTPIATTTAAPASTATSGGSSSSSGGAPTLAVYLDPSYTENSSDPFKVTWSYSASANGTSQSLPSGVLEFFADGSLVQSSDVGGSVTAATATVTYSTWGNHTVDVVYDSGTSSGTTGTETYDIEPPAPSPLAETWGTSSPTEGPSISATVSESETSDAVTLTDPNFEGATSVTLTDNNGNACSATVSGTTASCTMPNGPSTPTSFTVTYPGGTTTQTIDPYGVEQTQTVEWAADQVPVTDPSVTAPQTIDVSNEIPTIYAEFFLDESGGLCGTDPSGSYCLKMGVEGLPAGGTLQMAATYLGNSIGSCSVDLATNYDATAQTCSFVSADYPSTITATYSGYTDNGYDTCVYEPVSVTYTMVYDADSGSWWDYDGS